MEIEKVFTEQPEEEMWREILRFSYNKNIENFLINKGLDANEKLVECISGSFLQAAEYYNASKFVNLQISPLLLYYGTTNLLYGMSNLLAGNINEINNHGMHIELNEPYTYISETNIFFDNYNNGGIHVFSRALNFNVDLTKFGKWSVRELLSSIAEINNDYLKCYNKNESHIIPLEVTNTPTGNIEKVKLNLFNMQHFENMYSKVKNANNSYLRPAIGKSNGENQVILRHKINGSSISHLSFSEQPYLKVGHEKNGQLITLPSILYMYIVLFSFGSLCRYNPEKWNPFVKNDTTGEKLLIEKLLYFARRIIPNLILNHIYNKQMIFVNEKYSPMDTIKLVGEHDIKELIKKELLSHELSKEERKYGL